MRVDAFFLSCLMLLCGIAWAVDTPVLEYRTGSDLMQIRPTAYTAGIEGSSRSAAAAYTPITKTVTSTSMITPIIPVGSAGLRTWCNDTTRDVLLCNGGKILYTATFYGTTFTKTEVFNLAVNNAANPDYAYAASNSALTIQGVFCKDGVWLLSIGRYAIDITWCNYDDAYGGPLPVGSFDGTDGKNDAQSYYGCYDMSGNVYEWTSSIYSGSSRVVRGGYWINLADYCRVAHRGSSMPSYRGESIGFRLLLDL